MGTPEFSVPSLMRIVESDHELAGIVTRPDRRRGRGQHLAPPPVKAAVDGMGIPILQPESLEDPAFLEALQALEADLFAVVAFLILPRPVLEIPRLGSVNLHPSLLPRYRGAAPIPWAIIGGETETGVTIFRLAARVDAGDILLQTRIPIDPDEAAGELSDRLKILGADALVAAIDGLGRGDVAARPQPREGVTRAPKLERDDGRIDWRKDAESIRNLIRGTNPFPGASTVWKRRELKVHRATRVKAAGAPGEVVVADPKDGVVVATGEEALSLVEVQPAGKARMTGAELVRGYRIEAGERLGNAK